MAFKEPQPHDLTRPEDPSASPRPPEPAQPSQPGPDPARPAADGPQAAPDLEADQTMADRLRQSRASLALMLVVPTVFVLCARELGWKAELTSLRGWIPDATALKFGGYAWAAVRDQNEWWRMFTTLFVPRMGIDALFYMYIFWNYGPNLEKTLGTIRFLILYFGAGAAGVAVGELFDPANTLRTGMGHTMGAIYALLGGVPGLIAGVTGSPGAAIKNPAARGAVFYILFWTVFRYILLGFVEMSVVGGAAAGLVLGWGLGISLRSLGKGAAATGVGMALVAVLVGLVAGGKRVEGGKLVDRGRPASSGRTITPTDPEPVTEDAPPAIGTPEHASDAAKEALEPVTPFLDKFGPLPLDEGMTFADREEAGKHVATLEKVANGANMVVGELDPALARLHIICANYTRAAELADQSVTLAPDEGSRIRNRALAGVAWLHKGSLDKAIDRLDGVVAMQGFVEEQPEALFFLAKAYERRDGKVVAEAQFDRYLRTVGDGPHPPWRKRCVEQAKQALGR